MHPKPRADTCNPLLPNVRVCMTRSEDPGESARPLPIPSRIDWRSEGRLAGLGKPDYCRDGALQSLARCIVGAEIAERIECPPADAGGEADSSRPARYARARGRTRGAQRNSPAISGCQGPAFASSGLRGSDCPGSDSDSPSAETRLFDSGKDGAGIDFEHPDGDRPGPLLQPIRPPCVSGERGRV